MPTIRGQHHPRADTDRLYVPIKEEGRGLMQTKGAYIVEVIKLMECVESKEGPRYKQTNKQTNAALLQTVNNFKKSFQSESKQIA
jgi:hypothetical protein